MQRLLAYMARHKRRYAFGMFCLVATATLAMAIPYLLKCAVEVVERDPSLGGLGKIVLAIVALALVQGVVRAFSRFVIFNVGRDIEYDLRNDLFAHLEGLSLSYYQRQQTGDLMSRLVNDITAVRMLLGPGILNLVNTPVYYLYAVSIMFTIDVPLTLLSLLSYPAVLLIMKRASRQLMERTIKVQEGLADLSSRAQENLAGIGAVKAYALEKEEIERFRKMNDSFQETSLGLARVRGIIVPVMKLVSNAGLLVVLWYGGHLVVAGKISIGDLIAFMAYLHLLAWPTLALGWMLSIVQRGRAAMMRLEHIFAAKPEIVAPATNGEGVASGAVAIDDVTFHYPGSRAGALVLDGVSLSIAPGETVALVGRTGAGKTTLANLIPRLFDPDSGTVSIDGRDVRTLSLGALRRALGVVPQDPFLFSTTIRDNVAFGLTGNGQSDAKVRFVTSVAALDGDLAALPLGLETPVGERGITLSGGQKQRVTLARALAVEPKVLILDDALSSVDAETEKRILGGLRDAVPGQTCLLISHRVSTLKNADRILVLDGGRIVEEGTHAELLRRGGVYGEIFQEELLAAELESL